MAKGQKRSGREPKKPKKTAAERSKTSVADVNPQLSRIAIKDAEKKP
jgi:hypothetical protein